MQVCVPMFVCVCVCLCVCVIRHTSSCNAPVRVCSLVCRCCVRLCERVFVFQFASDLKRHESVSCCDNRCYGAYPPGGTDFGFSIMIIEQSDYCLWSRKPTNSPYWYFPKKQSGGSQKKYESTEIRPSIATLVHNFHANIR
jgi:hypothetical protein